jgi:hypothetical protein
MGKLRIGLWPTATAVAGCFSSVVGSTVQPPDESQGVFFFICPTVYTNFYKIFWGGALVVKY